MLYRATLTIYAQSRAAANGLLAELAAQCTGEETYTETRAALGVDKQPSAGAVAHFAEETQAPDGAGAYLLNAGWSRSVLFPARWYWAGVSFTLAEAYTLQRTIDGPMCADRMNAIYRRAIGPEK